MDISAPRGRLIGGTSRFALFAQALLVGAMVAVVSIPLVTLVPALCAAVRHLRRFLLGQGDSMRNLVADLWLAIRELWWVGAGLVLVLAVLGFNIWLAQSGVLPAGTLVTAVNAALAAAVCVVALRLSATWTASGRAWADLRAAARRSGPDVAGTALLFSALVIAAVLIWMLRPMLLIVGGLLALAALAVEHRWQMAQAERNGSD